MNEPLSIWALISEAGVVVKIVMALLMIASVISWGMIVQRGIYFVSHRRLAKQFEEQLWSGSDLNKLYQDGTTRSGTGGVIHGQESIFRAGFKEFSRLQHQDGVDADAVMEGTQADTLRPSREEVNLRFVIIVTGHTAIQSRYPSVRFS